MFYFLPFHFTPMPNSMDTLSSLLSVMFPTAAFNTIEPPLTCLELSLPWLFFSWFSYSPFLKESYLIGVLFWVNVQLKYSLLQYSQPIISQEGKVKPWGIANKTRGGYVTKGWCLTYKSPFSLPGMWWQRGKWLTIGHQAERSHRLRG